MAADILALEIKEARRGAIRCDLAALELALLARALLDIRISRISAALEHDDLTLLREGDVPGLEADSNG